MTQTQHDIQLGIFERFDRADAALQRLLDLGVERERISLVRTADGPPPSSEVEDVDASPEAVAPAAATGGAIGTVLGGLTAAVGVALSGGAGVLFVGPLLAGAAGGGIAGGFIGALTKRGVRPDVADLYDRALRDGQVLIAVEASEDEAQPGEELIERILRQAGAKTLEVPNS